MRAGKPVAYRLIGEDRCGFEVIGKTVRRKRRLNDALSEDAHLRRGDERDRHDSLEDARENAMHRYGNRDVARVAADCRADTPHGRGERHFLGAEHRDSDRHLPMERHL